MQQMITKTLLRRQAGISNLLGVRQFASKNETVGFIGLGNMGAHMANNLVKHKHNLVVYDVNQESVQKMVNQGCIAAKSPKEVASLSALVITMLPSAPHVKDVYLGSQGILAGAVPPTFLIDSSTIDPQTSQLVACEAEARKLTMLDAPVSGGVGGAEAGTLTFMVGGTESAFHCAEAILKKMGSHVVHCGGSGMGQTAKLCNNLILAISMIGVSEAMNLGIKLGMDPKVLAGIVNRSSGRCWSSDTYNPVPGVMEKVPSSRGYAGGFGSSLMLKDLGLVVSAAESIEAPIPMGHQALETYTQVVQAGGATKDFSYVYEFFKNKTER